MLVLGFSDGVGSKDMAVLPYKDSLLLFSRYLQQLVMESLGKEFDLDGNLIAVRSICFMIFKIKACKNIAEVVTTFVRTRRCIPSANRIVT
ncbi:hypothetical protein D5086_010904 [Populus alba]|uniref:Uncharacterized protein n=1 Tax=Populus alba TaxID=43335 RepID=A0ACC4CBF6_POPAL